MSNQILKNKSNVSEFDESQINKNSFQDVDVPESDSIIEWDERQCLRDSCLLDISLNSGNTYSNIKYSNSRYEVINSQSAYSKYKSKEFQTPNSYASSRREEVDKENISSNSFFSVQKADPQSLSTLDIYRKIADIKVQSEAQEWNEAGEIGVYCDKIMRILHCKILDETIENKGRRKALTQYYEADINSNTKTQYICKEKPFLNGDIPATDDIPVDIKSSCNIKPIL